MPVCALPLYNMNISWFIYSIHIYAYIIYYICLILQQNGIGYANPAFHSEDNDKTENGVAPPTVSAAVEAAPDNKTEVTTAQQAKRDRNPLFYCKLITNYPKTAFGEHATYMPCLMSQMTQHVGGYGIFFFSSLYG